jgi:hypothetical protein
MVDCFGPQIALTFPAPHDIDIIAPDDTLLEYILAYMKKYAPRSPRKACFRPHKYSMEVTDPSGLLRKDLTADIDYWHPHKGAYLVKGVSLDDVFDGDDHLRHIEFLGAQPTVLSIPNLLRLRLADKHPDHAMGDTYAQPNYQELIDLVSCCAGSCGSDPKTIRKNAQHLYTDLEMSPSTRNNLYHFFRDAFPESREDLTLTFGFKRIGGERIRIPEPTILSSSSKTPERKLLSAMAMFINAYCDIAESAQE